MPVGQDLDDDLLVVEEGAHKIYTFSMDDGEVVDEKETTFGTYLELFRNKLLSNRFEHIEDAGLVERMGASSPAGKGRAGSAGSQETPMSPTSPASPASPAPRMADRDYSGK